MKNKIKNTFLSLSLFTLLGTTSIFSTGLVRKTTTGTAFFLASSLRRHINHSDPLYQLARRNLYVSEFEVTTDSGGSSTSIYNNGNMQAEVKLHLKVNYQEGDSLPHGCQVGDPYHLTDADWDTAKIVPYDNASYDASMPDGWHYSHHENDYAHHIPGSGKKITATDELPIISHEEIMQNIQVVKPGETPQPSLKAIPQTKSLWVTCKDKLNTKQFAGAIQLKDKEGNLHNFTTHMNETFQYENGTSDAYTFDSSVAIQSRQDNSRMRLNSKTTAYDLKFERKEPYRKLCGFIDQYTDVDVYYWTFQDGTIIKEESLSGAGFYSSKLAFCFDKITDITGHIVYSSALRKGAVIKKDVTHLSIGSFNGYLQYSSDEIALDCSPHTLRAVRYSEEYARENAKPTGNYDTPVHWTIRDQYGTDHHFKLYGIETVDSTSNPDSMYNRLRLVDDCGNVY